ncbi:TPA: MARTX multifunctional-autoprocessing repeats-in-toxin holotoxin RtxA [Yersinia enterocolitica]|uniref:MARTX multifunctional-autoprocessing repeats-in-toxin holotoxin RtxA n=2 Tax=Yersinia enterocolitica TaxID=630 RepID=UPI002814852B|nr:MARTX multifunctional-autoprocessing repeats-in-toxin holotoxin RtxA [Yersinia enterocolitica]HDL6749826.1 MARTX multifunctional-autoprocessing repeats-in-toxin holotoxin RtxA [Yersinia enterocolitica]HDL7876289.1 MARTX multifunctional-autoprocessing repeats-in-toxin holotoxin RtxA [Yersinia enterocolitica]HDM8314775.1 MARTX multifunctional-autoprocessing repeats-in-toxin holotoxin RtxA [Yersinia enterocolitica]HDM8440932.1 MARTX multifunctional-autoprocessing repeats-in-toxin holotoxin RtxA
MSKASNRSAEYFFTGVYNGDDSNNDIDAIGLGGMIYARGGDDDILVGSIAAKVEAGSGDDTIKGGAAYLEVLDTTGKLTVKGAAGAMNIIKEGDGDIDATVVAGANIINHTGNSGNMNIFAIGAYNKITRKSRGYGTNGKLTLDDIVLGDARFENEKLGISTDKVSAVKMEDYYLYEHKYNHDGYTCKALTKVYLFQDEKTGDVKTKKTTTISVFDRVTKHWHRTSEYNNGHNYLVDIDYNFKATKIKTKYSGEVPKKWLGGDSILLKYEDELLLKKDNLTLNAIKLSDGNLLSAIKSTGKPGVYYFVSSKYIYEIEISDASTYVNIDGKRILTPCQGMKFIPYKRTVPRGRGSRPNVKINKIPDGLVERTGSTDIGQYKRVVNIANVPSIDSVSFNINEEVMVDKKLNRLEPSAVLNITNMNLINSSDDINFEGGGIANVIESDVVTGNVTFKGGGAANIITHAAVKGNTDFTGGGIANIIVKSGGEGNLTFNGGGLANVLVHKSQKGDMKVNAGGAVNVMVRLGNGQYDVTLTALGNISVHSGDGNSIVKMLGGLNTHTQIGDGEAFWIAAGGLNVLTKKGQGSLFSVVGGGGNVVTRIGQGDLTIVALGLGNIITHISDDEHSASTMVITVAAANIVTKKGRGDMQAILAGGLNVLTHVGNGKTDAIMLGGGNILTKVGNGNTNGIMFGLGNIFTHVGDGQTLGVMAGGGNIYTKVGNGTTIAAMLAAGNIMTQIGNGNTYVLMAALGNVITKVGDGDLLALMIAKGNILTQVGDGQTFALMLAKGGNILTKVGNGTTLAAMISVANVMTHIGNGQTFALMIGKANIFTKVGSGLTVGVMVGNVNIYSQINNHKNEAIGIGIFIGKLNVMTKVGDGTALAIMVGEANVMTHIGNGVTGGIALAKGNIITKVGDGFMGVLAKAEGNVITHVGTGVTAVALHGKGNILTKVGDDTTIGLLISQTGNIMTHVGNGLTIGIAKGKGNIISKVGDGIGINAVWGEFNVITQVGDGERYNFAKGKGNIITRVGKGQEVTVAKGDANIISAVGDIDNYTFAWGKQNVITAVGSGRNVVVAKADNNVVTKVGDGDAYNILLADNNIVTTVGKGQKITVAKGKVNVTTDVGDGLNVTAVYGDTNVNTKVGDGTSVNAAWGKYNINTKVGDGLNVAVMKGKANINVNIGDGLSVVATYGRNNVSVKVGNGDYYNLSVAASNTQSNKLATLFGNIKQNLLGRAGSQAIDYLVNGTEGQTTGFRNGHGGFNLPEINNLNGFKLNEDVVAGKFEPGSGAYDFNAKSNNLTKIDTPNLGRAENNALKALGSSDNTEIRNDIQGSTAHSDIENKVDGDKKRAEEDSQQLQRHQEKHTANASVIQSQLEGTDKAELATTGAEYQKQMEQQANELVTEQQRISQSINDISVDKNTGAGEGYRQHFAREFLQDINEKLNTSVNSAHENIDKSQAKVNEYTSRVNEAVARSESALAKGEQDKERANAEQATAQLEADTREEDAQKQNNEANEAHKKALKDVDSAQRRGDDHLNDANNEAEKASKKAKSVQRSEGDTPNDRKEAQGSGLKQGQKAYHTDVKVVSDADISPVEGAIPDSHPMAVADKRISNKITNVSAAEGLTTGKSKIKNIQQLIATVKNNDDYLDIPKAQSDSAIHSSFMNWVRKQGMGKYVHNKHDKALSFDFSQTTAILLPRARDIYNLGKQHVTHGKTKSAMDMWFGVCFGLSAKYMIVARNYGPEGAKDYFSYIESLNKANPKNAKDIINSNVRKIYNGFSLSYDKATREIDLVSTLKLQNSQSFYSSTEIIDEIYNFEKEHKNDKVNTKKYLGDLNKFMAPYGLTKKPSFDEGILSHFGETASSAEISDRMVEQFKLQNIEANNDYGGELARYGLKSVNTNDALNPSKEGYVDTIGRLENPTEDTFVAIQSKDHAMSIAIHKKEGGHIWSFFEPNYGGVSFHDYKSFKKFMDDFTKNRNSYEPSGRKDQLFALNFNIFTSNKETKKVDGVWDSWRRGKDEFIINEFKNSGAVFKFDKKTNGKVVDFTTRKDADNNLNVDSVTIELSDKKNSFTHRIQVQGSDVASATNKLTPYISNLNKLKGNRHLLMIADQDSVRFVNNYPQEQAEEVLTIPLSRLKTLGDDVYNPLKVNEWDSSTVKDGQTNNTTRYHSQIIVQLENDPVVAEAAANLAAKHPGSILVQVDSDGQYRLILGEPTSLQGNIRWQLVGHGRDSNNGQGNQTMANDSASDLAARVKCFKDKIDSDYRIKSSPNYISLVGCSLVNKDKQQGFAQSLLRELDNRDIHTEVGARSSRILIDAQGRKLTEDTDGNFRHKASEDKVKFSFNQDGEIVTRSESVNNNVNESEIDLHRIGAKAVDLPATGAIGRNTEEFTPPETKPRIETAPQSTDKDQAVSYSGNINIQIGDDEFTSINWGTSNLGIKVGNGGFKTLVFGDNNIMVHIGDGMSKHSVNIGGYQAFEGVQVFMGTRNISFNHGHSNDLIFMTEKTVLSPPLVNPFDGATRICVTLEDIANEGHGDNWLKAQYQQWTPSSARQYLNDLSLLDSSSSVDYNNLIEIDPELINRSIDFRSSRGLQHDFTMMFNKKYNEYISKPAATTNSNQAKTTKADKLRKLNDTMVFNIAIAGQGADIIVTNSNWNFTFGDNIQSIMDINLGSLFAISTQQVTQSGRVKTTMTYSPTDLPRQIKNKLLHKLSLVESDMTLGDIFGVDYDAEGNIISRTGEAIDGEKILKEMLEVVAEFGGEKLKVLSDPQKLLNGLKANLNMGENAITSFAQAHGLQDKAPTEVDETATVNRLGSTTTQPAGNKDQPFGFNSLNLPNLFATLFNKDKQTEMVDMVDNLKQNMAQDLLNMEEKTFDFLRNSGFLRGDGDLNWSLGNYNFTFGGHGNDLGAYLGDNNNFWGGQGDDTFYGTGISNVFTGGQGNDTGVLMGRENTMFGGAGEDTAVLAGRINHAELGSGNDKAFLFGEAGTANMGAGDDYAVMAGNYNQVNGDQGQDYVVLMGNANVAELGQGDDHCVVFGNENTASGDEGNDTIKLMGYSSIIMGRDGNDHLIADVISKYSDFYGGGGEDTLELGGYKNNFQGQDGVDSFVVSTSVIDCAVTDISREDKILINNVSWRDLWLQRSENNLTILVRRPVADDSAQGDFERVGSVTFNDYFNDKRAAIVVSDKGSNGSPGGYEALTDSAVDGLIDNMNNFSVSDGTSSLVGQMDNRMQQQIAGLWANTIQHTG